MSSLGASASLWEIYSAGSLIQIVDFCQPFSLVSGDEVGFILGSSPSKCRSSHLALNPLRSERLKSGARSTPSTKACRSAIDLVADE